jgi:hypothetical protein
MDTSQAHLSSKAQVKDTSKPENLSKDELTAVLKYGAQKMYVFSNYFLVLFISPTQPALIKFRSRTHPPIYTR